jgi:hypothetical protein
MRLWMLAVSWETKGESTFDHYLPLEHHRGGTIMLTAPSLETLVDATLRGLREQVLRELTEGPAQQGTLDQIEAVVERLESEFRHNLQCPLLEERTTSPRENTAPLRLQRASGPLLTRVSPRRPRCRAWRTRSGIACGMGCCGVKAGALLGDPQSASGASIICDAMVS